MKELHQVAGSSRRVSNRANWPPTSNSSRLAAKKVAGRQLTVLVWVSLGSACLVCCLGGQQQQLQSKLLANNTTQPAPSVKVNFTDCGARNIKEVRISPCPGDGSVCNINLGTNVTVEADFVAKHEASSLSEVIKGVVRGREMQFPEQRTDPCKSTISPGCPIKLGKLYQYKASFEIKPYYPAIPVKVRYALANQAGDIVACVQIAAKIIDPAPSVRSSRNKPKKKSSK